MERRERGQYEPVTEGFRDVDTSLPWPGSTELTGAQAGGPGVRLTLALERQAEEHVCRGVREALKAAEWWDQTGA